MSKNNIKESKYSKLLAKERLSDNSTAPLVYLVHGRAGSVDVMWAFRRCFPDEFSAVSMQAPLIDNTVPGHSWWQVKPDPDGIEAVSLAAESLYGFCKEFEASNNLEPVCRIALGFSQGAGLLSMLMQNQPEFFHGIGLLAGFVIENKIDSRIHQAESIPEIFMAHGTEDDVIPISKALDSKRLLESWGCEVDFYQDPTGHKVGSSGMRALKEWCYSFA